MLQDILITQQGEVCLIYTHNARGCAVPGVSAYISGKFVL